MTPIPDTLTGLEDRLVKGPTRSQRGSAAQPDVQTAGAGTVSAETTVSTPRGLGAGVLAPLQFINYLGLLLEALCAHPQAASDLWQPALQRLYLEGHFLSWNHASRSRPSPVKCLGSFWGKRCFPISNIFMILPLHVLSCSVVSDSETPWTVARQPPPTVGFSRQENWGGLSFPSPGDLPHLGIEPVSLASSALAGRYLTTAPRLGPLPTRQFHVLPFPGQQWSLQRGSAVWALGVRLASRTLSGAVQGRASVSREQAQRSAPPWGLQRPRVSRERPWPPEHIWGWQADTLEWQCSHLPAFPVPRHLSGRGGAPAGPRQPGRDAQGPDAPGSRFLPLSVLPRVRPPGWRALPHCAPACVLHKHASCTSERVQAPLPGDPR